MTTAQRAGAVPLATTGRTAIRISRSVHAARRVWSSTWQGWAFSWRSLLAGELLVPFDGASSLGGALNYSRSVPGGAEWLLALMIVILILGMVMDAVFGVVTRRVRERRGLTGALAGRR